ncbi:hypothetical protein LOTGIDRAFT_138555 [Lottia gigantea]|uniref:Ubiquitin carboxyl-terminal hydrolase n=1 Tax=Lottia gigantea TaxID=225164 RepID=V4B4G4_LOTGI|nr:hypothetical protein LOTGIDRAFT_138555 [Lottia gigantea]ESP02356.1 hypothetical protein LOTGIDRAFT_138555 [Lottia gigantea]
MFTGSGVIDLTKDTTGDNEDLQKAIAASLHETPGILGGQVTREEQDISRILEASLAESKAGTKRKRGDIWFVDPLNPHERKRVEQWPVGLKNVGNTCWFSAVIQSLFHIRQFRQLVLNFDFSLANADNVFIEYLQDTRNISFMEELQCLFALLVGTSKKYVDPSKPVEILKEAFTSPTGANNSQQDVSEFQHKLLEWLEDAFKVYENKPKASTEANCDNNVKSPVVDLFYGQFKAEGIHEGKGFSNLETFGQFPLQVSGFRDIHESLEAATSPAEIEAVSSDVTQKSGQELWFTRLPPVLTFELSRFQFNQQIGRPEKIHNKIQFPEVIYMDRYMERNQSITRQRREDGKKLKEQLRCLKAKLDKFLRYGSGNKRVPLQDVLQYALEFAQSKKHDRTSSASNQDIEMESPRTNTNNNERLSADVPDLPDIAMTTYSQSPGPSARSVDGVTPPYPRHVEDSELEVLEGCLRRWRTEVESDVRELQENISSLEEKVSGMYSDESMKKFPYHLHAVLVHEGQAASGHYWAYIYDILREKWLKFNDITVTESSWEELEKEGVGGYHNASAYCLMYVDRSKLQYNTDTAKFLDSMECLPPELFKMVTEDNKLFVKEIQTWNEDQARKTAEAEAKTASEKKIAKTSTQTSQTALRYSLPITHANISFTDTLKAVKQYVDLRDCLPKDSLIQAVNQELKRLAELSKRVSVVLPQDDLRLQHILIYMGHNSADIKLQQIIELEQFSFIKDLDTSERGKEMRKFASEYVQKIQNEYGSDIYKRLEDWHCKYQLYREVVYLFIKGLEAYNKERYAESLPYLDKAWHCNIDCTVNGKHEGLGVNKNILAYFRRTCLQCLNTSAAELFESEEDVSEALTLMNSLILPTLPLLSSSGVQHDVIAAEEMKEKWCAFLGEQLSGKLISGIVFLV